MDFFRVILRNNLQKCELDSLDLGWCSRLEICPDFARGFICCSDTDLSVPKCEAALNRMTAGLVVPLVTCRLSIGSECRFSVCHLHPKMSYDAVEPTLNSSGLGFPCFRKIRLGGTEWDVSWGKPWTLLRWEAWRLITSTGKDIFPLLTSFPEMILWHSRGTDAFVRLFWLISWLVEQTGLVRWSQTCASLILKDLKLTSDHLFLHVSLPGTLQLFERQRPIPGKTACCIINFMNLVNLKMCFPNCTLRWQMNGIGWENSEGIFIAFVLVYTSNCIV